MRISDWSSDVCSSDLAAVPFAIAGRPTLRADRNFFGALTVTEVESAGKSAYRRLDHGSTKHGIQFMKQDRRCESPSYHGERSEERRVGNECVRTGRPWWSPEH